MLWAGRHEGVPHLIVRLGAAVRTLPAHKHPLVESVLVEQATYGMVAHCPPPSPSAVHHASFVRPAHPQLWRSIAVVVDCDGLSLRHRPPVDVIRAGIPALLQAAEDNGGTCTALLLVHVPPAMSFVLRVIRGVLDADTRRKLRVLGTREWLALAASLSRGARLAGGVPWRATGPAGSIEVAAEGDAVASLRLSPQLQRSPRDNGGWGASLDDAAMEACGRLVTAPVRSVVAFVRWLLAVDDEWHYGWWPGQALPIR